jgi:hypothetical protein
VRGTIRNLHCVKFGVKNVYSRGAAFEVNEQEIFKIMPLQIDALELIRAASDLCI